MTDDQPPTDDRPGTGSVPDADRRRLLAICGGAGVALLAGCASGTDLGGAGPSGGGAGSEPTATTGTFRLLISDRPVAIDEFDRLDVSFDRARVFRSGGGADGGEVDVEGSGEEDDGGEEDLSVAATGSTATETAAPAATESPTPTANATTTTSPTPTASATATGPTESAAVGAAGTDGDGSDGDGSGGGRSGYSVIDLGGATVDLTAVVGARAMGVFEGELPAGRYTKIELYAADVEGVVDGEVVDVTVPSGKLLLTKPFVVEPGTSLSFVFDVTVVRKGGNGYNLLPVVGESGVAGEDVAAEVVERGSKPEAADEPTEDGETTAGGSEGSGAGDGTGGEGNGPPEGT